jgi:hypothetical protein
LIVSLLCDVTFTEAVHTKIIGIKFDNLLDAEVKAFQVVSVLEISTQTQWNSLENICLFNSIEIHGRNIV